MKGSEGEPQYASVAVPIPPRRLFTYSVGQRWREEIEIGSRVRVPFGGRKLVATVVDWPSALADPTVEVKPLEVVLRDAPRLSRELLELTRFVADYYLCSWGEAIDAALPPDPGTPLGRKVVRRLSAADPTRLSRRAVARRRLLHLLPEDGGWVSLRRLDSASRRAIRPLRDLGWVEVGWERAPKAAASAENAPERPPESTEAQRAVLQPLERALNLRSYRPFLLFGATGSGKTEVYLRAAQSALLQGRGVLYLVPEIGLTPLLISTISRRFPGQAVVLHSNLSRRDRGAAWSSVRSGACRFVLGTRSAVFAPLRDVGLIVIDEEQDSSYKQTENPRYNGRDVAVVRARNAQAVLLLGSATPSLESFRHAATGRYELLRLGGRIDARPLAEVTIVDMREEFQRSGEVSPLSSRFLETLGQCLDRKEQALVLRNRRGWSVALLCPQCGNRVGCPQCTVSLTWHRAERRLRCHTCEFEQPYPDQCPTCGEGELHLIGEGTERVEDLLRETFPDAVIERMDRDTIRRRGAHEALLRRFAEGNVDVLVGTQMIAKGHDFPRVTLVGVVSADQSLGLPDFRAGERTFQLLTQVAGRAGRGRRPGSVVVQAFDPAHPVIRLAAAQDYEAFYSREIRYRQALRYPPVSALVRILVQEKDEMQARLWAERVAEVLREVGGGRLLLAGPGPAPVERIRGRYRQQILVRTAGRQRLVQAVDRALVVLEGAVPRRALHVDVDPIALL